MSSKRMGYFHPCHFRTDSGKLCFNWKCARKECREAMFYLAEGQITLGAEDWSTMGEMWFITLYNAIDHHKYGEDYFRGFQSRCTHIINNLRQWARKEGIPFAYARVNGLKSENAAVPFELHTHLCVTFIPSPTPDPTPAYPDRWKSEKLVTLAGELGLKAWVEKPRSVEAVARYSANNLKHFDGVALPRYFKRFTTSHNWYPLDRVTTNKLHARAAGFVWSKRKRVQS